MIATNSKGEQLALIL